MSIDETPAHEAIEDEAGNDQTILSPPSGNALASPTESDLTIVVADSGASIAPPPKGPKFAELGLRPEVLRALDDMGFEAAMEVQTATLPLARARKDLMVQSRTGSGKTAAFGIPFVNDIVDPEAKMVQALVLLPTRELALQVAAELARIAVHRPITVAPIYGGAPMGRQIEMLRAGAQIVCGTPGRILDHLRRGTLSLKGVRCAVLDECDEMLSMGFQEDIEHILEQTPESRQTLLFSATVPEGIQRLSRRFLRNPEFLKLSADFVGVHEIRHVYYSIPGINREQELLRILNFEDPRTAIIFCNTREETSRVADFLQKQGFEAEAISSDLSQIDRERVMTRMRAGQIRFLVATDVAARGIDIEGLSHVFNYTFPEAPEIYIHRTGRTGRAGKHGTAISLIGPTEVGSFYYLKLLYKIRPEERALPSEAEIRSHREGERVLQLRLALAGDPGVEWRGLARRIVGAIDGERLVATLLAQSFASLPMMPPVVVAKVAATPSTRAPNASEPRSDRPGLIARESATPQPGGENDRAGGRDREPSRDRTVRADRGDRNGRDRRPERGRDRDRPRDRDQRGPREGREGYPRRERDAAAPATAATERPRNVEAGPIPSVASTDSPSTEKEFWEIWSEEKAGRAAPATDVQAPAPMASPAPAHDTRPAAVDTPPGMARLYLNLGRKDGASQAEIRGLLREHAGIDDVHEIDVMNTHTYLNVDRADADRICASLTGKRMGDRDLVCEGARPRR